MHFGWRLMMMMMAKGKRDIPIIKPVHLKFGVALAISFGGIFYTYCRIKKIKSSKSNPSHLSPGSNGNQANSRGQNDDQHDLQSSITTDLSSSKEYKIKLSKKKLRFEAEQNRIHVLTLQERVMKMKTIDEDVEMKIYKRDELKEELEEVKKSNKGLETVNSDLATKLEYVQKLVTSDLNNEEVQELKEESKLLKQRNEDLTKEIERLQADHCKDMEELVYLRWVNACFRHELRKSKTVSMDVTKKLSPKPEGISDSDFDASSCLTDSGENDDSWVDTIKTTKNSSKKTKVFTKLKKIFSFRAPNTPLQRAASVDDIVGRCSSGSSRRSLDSRFQDSNSSRRTSDDDSSWFSRRIDSLSQDDNVWSPSIQPREGVTNEMIL